MTYTIHLSITQFDNYLTRPLIIEDTFAYEIIISGNESQIMQVNVKKPNGVRITGIGQFQDGALRYVLDRNMYDIIGDNMFDIAILDEYGTRLTTSRLFATSEIGTGTSDISGSTDIPVLTSLIAQTQQAVNSVNNALVEANEAVTNADQAVTRANDAVTRADESIKRADDAVADAQDAILDADTAITRANTAISGANTAAENANNAATRVPEMFDELYEHIDDKSNPHEVTAEQVGSIRDAAIDGILYGRKDGAWSEITSGGSLPVITSIEADALKDPTKAGVYIIKDVVIAPPDPPFDEGQQRDLSILIFDSSTGSGYINLSQTRINVLGTYIRTTNNDDMGLVWSAWEIVGMDVIYDLTSTSITLYPEPERVYRFGTLTSLTIYSGRKSWLEVRIHFTSGATPTVLTVPSYLSNNNLTPNVTIKANKRYIISILDDTMTIGEMNPL